METPSKKPSSFVPTKFCIFCGRKPVDKTREHVLPQWLIALTGDPQRQGMFGIDWTKKPPVKRSFAFDQFTFPACQTCNGEFSSVETRVRPILGSMLEDGPLSAEDLTLLLDWFDKVRTGLWLGFQMLDKNIWQITPRFHITKRVGSSDRALIIGKFASDKPRLGFAGTLSPSFQFMPIAFALAINHLMLINVSNLALCCRRLGFPYTQPTREQKDGRVEGVLRPGLNRAIYPVLPHFPHPAFSGIYQPMFGSHSFQGEASAINAVDMYHHAYVESNMLDFSAGIGRPFLQVDGRVQPYPKEPSKTWSPTRVLSIEAAIREANDFSYSHQIKELENAVRIRDIASRSSDRKVIKQLKKIKGAIDRRMAEGLAFSD